MKSEEVLHNLHELKNTSGINAKKEKLAELMKLDLDMPMVLHHLVNTLEPTGIGKKMWDKAESVEPTTEFTPRGFVHFLRVIPTVNTGVVKEVKSQTKHMGELAYILATKDFKMGITSTTYNKVAGELGMFKVPTVSPMLAKNINDIKPDKLEDMIARGVYVTTKLDGIRAIAMHGEKGWTIHSRNGKEITGLEHITKGLEDLINVSIGRVYDGELILPSEKNAEDAFRDTSSMVNGSGDKSKLVFNVFDAPLEDDFLWNAQTEYYKKRRIIVDKLAHNNTPIQPVPVLGYISSMEQLNDMFDEAIRNGEEGLMINANAGYYPKRTDKLLKMKQVNSADLRVIGFEEGSGRLKGTLGAIVVNYKGNTLKVGTGFSEVERDMMWLMHTQDKNYLIGDIVEVGYTTESQDKDGNKSLRFPRFIGVRNDKEEESYD